MDPRPYITPTPGRLLAHDLAVEAARMVYRRVERVPPSGRSLADQARRAAASVPLNLAEASGRAGWDRLRHHRIAHGSSEEATSCIPLLQSIGMVDPSQATKTLAILDRVNALTWRLSEPRT